MRSCFYNTWERVLGHHLVRQQGQVELSLPEPLNNLLLTWQEEFSLPLCAQLSLKASAVGPRSNCFHFETQYRGFSGLVNAASERKSRSSLSTKWSACSEDSASTKGRGLDEGLDTESSLVLPT